MICRGAGFGRKVALAPAFRLRRIDSREIRRWPLSGFRNFHNKLFGRKSIISYICNEISYICNVITKKKIKL